MTDPDWKDLNIPGNYCLTAADSGLTVSNEIISEHARVTFAQGVAYDNVRD